jgi:uncharacterized membrane protein
MGVEWTFIIWLIVVILVFFLARNYNITWWSSLVLALWAGLFILLIGCGYCLFELGSDCRDDDSSCDYRKKKRNGDNSLVMSLLGFILLISIVVIVIYNVQRIFDDQCEC